MHSWSIGKSSERPWVSVTGTLANLRFEMGGHWLKIDYGDSQETRRFDDDHWGITAMVLEFRRCILDASEPAMTGEEALKDLALVLKAYASVHSGLPARLG